MSEKVVSAHGHDRIAWRDCAEKRIARSVRGAMVTDFQDVRTLARLFLLVELRLLSEVLSRVASFDAFAPIVKLLR